MTTGSASAVIVDADDQPGATIAPGALCGGAPCAANAVGAPLTCGAFDVPGPLGFDGFPGYSQGVALG